MLDLARGAGAPSIVVPAELPHARAALGALVVAPLVVLDRLGLISGVTARVTGAVGPLARRRDELIGPANLALDVARRIGRTFPVVHGWPGVGAVAAARWKTQVNENAKTPAFFSAHPELDYNDVAGWGQSGDVTRQILTLVPLRHRGESPSVARRFELVAEALREVVADIVPVTARGDEDLARFFDLALVGDFVSLHLAAREGVDPGPEPVVTEIERAVGNL